YHQGLGLDEIVWSFPGARFLSADGYHHHVGLNTWARGATLAGPHDARLLEWQIVAASPQVAESAAASLRKHGQDVEPRDGGWVAVDPSGVAVRISADEQ